MMRSTWEPVVELSPAQVRTRGRLMAGLAVLWFVIAIAAVALFGVVTR